MTDLTNAEKRAIHLQREAFKASYEWVCTRNYTSPSVIEREAIRRYPDPKEPTIVTVSSGDQYRIQNGHLHVKHPANEWTGLFWTPSDLLALGDIARESLTQTPSRNTER